MSEVEPCRRCGLPHERDGMPTCRGHRNRRGDQPLRPCMAYPANGTAVCRNHGGTAPQTIAAAHRREAADAMDEVLRLAVGEVSERHLGRTPDEQLLEEVARSAQIVEWLAARVAELNVPRPPGTAGAFEDVLGIDPETGEEIMREGTWDLFGPDHLGEAAPHIYWAALDRERDRHARFCKLAIDAGISERMVRIAESVGVQIVAVILYVVDHLQLGPEQRDEARRLAADYMRSIGPGGPVIEVAAAG